MLAAVGKWRESASASEAAWEPKTFHGIMGRHSEVVPAM
jgi:hypothetical protein